MRYRHTKRTLLKSHAQCRPQGCHKTVQKQTCVLSTPRGLNVPCKGSIDPLFWEKPVLCHPPCSWTTCVHKKNPTAISARNTMICQDFNSSMSNPAVRGRAPVWPLTPPALESVYKVPTLLISVSISPELWLPDTSNTNQANHGRNGINMICKSSTNIGRDLFDEDCFTLEGSFIGAFLVFNVHVFPLESVLPGLGLVF